ncbi:transposase [Paracoccus versutus]|nr:transposase [Paracoccus versutus]
MNVSALARRLGISPPQLFGWRKAFLKKQNADAPAGAPAPVVEIVVGEVMIRVGPARIWGMERSSWSREPGIR